MQKKAQISIIKHRIECDYYVNYRNDGLEAELKYSASPPSKIERSHPLEITRPAIAFQVYFRF